LPDGLFSNQKSRFGQVLDGLRLENVDIFYGHLEHFTAIWYNLQPFGIVCGHLVHFPGFGIICQEKSCNPAVEPPCSENKGNGCTDHCRKKLAFSS
jgi:hypothetical protein